ncbi:MAG: hypothetical protein ACO1N5_11645, partial [Noviherbaspirillum sp.]
CFSNVVDCIILLLPNGIASQGTAAGLRLRRQPAKHMHSGAENKKRCGPAGHLMIQASRFYTEKIKILAQIP